MRRETERERDTYWQKTHPHDFRAVMFNCFVCSLSALGSIEPHLDALVYPLEFSMLFISGFESYQSFDAQGCQSEFREECLRKKFIYFDVSLTDSQTH